MIQADIHAIHSSDRNITSSYKFACKIIEMTFILEICTARHLRNKHVRQKNIHEQKTYTIMNELRNAGVLPKINLWHDG